MKILGNLTVKYLRILIIVVKSVPHYNDIQNYVVSLSEWYLKDKTRVYDLGCSTGETIKKISNLNLNNFVELIGIDQSSKMLQIAKQRIKI